MRSTKIKKLLQYHVKNKKYGNFVSISSLTGKCAAQKFKNFCHSSLLTCLHHMVILRCQNKITDFFMILDLGYIVCIYNLPDQNCYNSHRMLTVLITDKTWSTTFFLFLRNLIHSRYVPTKLCF